MRALGRLESQTRRKRVPKSTHAKTAVRRHLRSLNVLLSAESSHWARALGASDWLRVLKVVQWWMEHGTDQEAEAAKKLSREMGRRWFAHPNPGPRAGDTILLGLWEALLDAKRVSGTEVQAADSMGRWLTASGFSPELLNGAATVLSSGERTATLLALVAFEDQLNGYDHPVLRIRIRHEILAQKDLVRRLLRELADVVAASPMEGETRSLARTYLRLIALEFVPEKDDRQFFRELYGKSRDNWMFSLGISATAAMGNVRRQLDALLKGIDQGRPVDWEKLHTRAFWVERLWQNKEAMMTRPPENSEDVATNVSQEKEYDPMKASVSSRVWIVLERQAERQADKKDARAFLEEMKKLEELWHRAGRDALPSEPLYTRVTLPSLSDVKQLAEELPLLQEALYLLERAS